MARSPAILTAALACVTAGHHDRHIGNLFDLVFISEILPYEWWSWPGCWTLMMVNCKFHICSGLAGKL